jgi:hypothetical protein
MTKIFTKIHKELHYTMYVGNTDITLVMLENNVFSHLIISSVNNNNNERLIIDNKNYIEEITENKKDLKTSLQNKNLWEKNIVQAIKALTKKVL